MNTKPTKLENAIKKMETPGTYSNLPFHNMNTRIQKIFFFGEYKNTTKIHEYH